MNIIIIIISKTNYDNYKVYIGDTGSSSENKEKIKDFIKDKEKFILCEFDYYNFGRINNYIVNEYVDKDSELLFKEFSGDLYDEPPGAPITDYSIKCRINDWPLHNIYQKKCRDMNLLDM